MAADKTNTPEEIVDVVDENDRIIGQATKGEVNSNPKIIHREIGILIYNEQGKVYIQQRSMKKRMLPGFWIESVAGHIPTGMDPAEGAHKELIEELGFDTELQFRKKTLISYPTETFFEYLYSGKFPSNQNIKLDPNEAQQGRFVGKKELEEMLMAEEMFDEYSLADIKEFLNSNIPAF